MATLTVTTNADTGTGSLRAAIASASAGDTIVFDPSLYGSIILLASALSPAVSLEIQGALDDSGVPQITIDGSNSVRGFAVSAQSVTLTLRRLTIQNCRSANPGGGVQLARSNGRLVAYDCVFKSNVARQGADLYGVGTFTACSFYDASTLGDDGPGSNASGGCVYNPYATACVFETCDFSRASSRGSGAVYYSTTASASFSNCSFSGSTAADDSSVCAAASFSNCTFDDGETLALSGASTIDSSHVHGVELANSTTLTVAGVAVIDSLQVDTSATLAFNSNTYLGVGSVVGAEGLTVSGSGFLATNASVTLPNTITRCAFGAGLTGVSANNLTISWTATDSTKSVLLEVENGASWDTVDNDATSPTTVSTYGKYRMWDGVVFLTIDVTKTRYWQVRAWAYMTAGGGEIGDASPGWIVTNKTIGPNLNGN